jgi:nucleotide-binding universal stress UspA family protein
MTLWPMAVEPKATGGLVIAFDGSDASREAVERAAELFPGRTAVIATIWEPGLAQMATTYDTFGTGSMSTSPDPRVLAEVDRAQHDHAGRAAQAGAELAMSLGLVATPRAVEDHVDVADTLVDLAEETGAAVLVVGSRGLKGLRSHIEGSVARKLLTHCRCPVLVVRHQQ